MIKTYTVIPYDAPYDEPIEGEVIELRVATEKNSPGTLTFKVIKSIGNWGSPDTYRVEGFTTIGEYEDVGVTGFYKIHDISEKLGIVLVYEP